MSRFGYVFILFAALYCLGSAEELTDLLKLRASSKSAIVPFKDSHVKKFIFRASDRPYNLYILFDPAEDSTCPYCVQLRKTVQFVAAVYNQTLAKRDTASPHVFFVSVNPNTAQEIFIQFQVQALPLLAFLPSGSSEASTLVTFPLTSVESLTEPFQLVDWIQDTSNVLVPIPLPLHRRPEVQYTVIALGVLLVLYFLPYLLRNYNHPMVGFVLGLIVYVVVMNGTVWNAIHEPPYWGGRGNVFMPGLHSQFKIEGAIMSCLFVALMTLWVLLTKWAPFTHRYLRVPAVLFVMAGLLFLMNSIFRIFSHKKMGGGYPFYFDIPAIFA